jgi:hypothetical protein
MERDMYSFYGGVQPLTDEENSGFLEKWTLRMTVIEKLLTEENY